MSSLTKIIQPIIIVFLIGVIIYLLTLPSDIKEGTVITKKTVEIVPITIETPVYVPKYRTLIDTITDIDTFIVSQGPIDTSEILKDYYSTYTYQDTIQIDTFGNIIVKDTITKNYILARKVQSNLEIPKITIENTVYINNREWYTGVGLVGGTNQISYIGAEILYRTKKRKAIGIGLGVNRDLFPQASFKLCWKIGK